jgi:uncharacterized protein YdcH (DUF465 family)
MFEFDRPIVERLLEINESFKRLYDKHEELEQQLEDAYTTGHLGDDFTMGKLKKEKLLVKDKLAKFIEEQKQTHSPV